MPERKNSTGQFRFQLMTAVCMLAFVLCVRSFWPAGTEKLKEFLLPGEPSGTEAAFSNLVSNLKDGDRIGDAIAVFCGEIIDHAQISD